jgi:hypothetical protein
MSRQLIAYVDRGHDRGETEPGSDRAGAPAFEAWPSLKHARTGDFQRVILIAEARFHWDEVIRHVADRALEEDQPAPAAAPEAAPPVPAAEESTEADASAETPVAAVQEPGTPEMTAPEETAGETDVPPAVQAEPAEPAEPPETATAEGAAATAPPAETASAKPPRRPREPKRPAPKSIEEVRSRLRHMAQTAHIDRAAVDKLCQELAKELGVPSVIVRVMPPFARDREQVSFIRSVVGLLEAHVPAVLDFADGPRMAAGLGLTLSHGLASLRPDVPLAELTLDRSRNLGFHPRSLLHAIEIQELWREVARGATPAALVEHMRADNRLQGLAAPYQRYARALEFGNPAEAARAARTVQQRISELTGKGGGDDWTAAIRPAMEAMTGGLVQDQPWSRRQLWMAEAAAKRGMHFLAALHIRETLVSALLETYGQNAARGWAATKADERGEARIRPREVMAVVLADPHSARLVPDLGQVWQWVGNPRNRFVMTSPVAVDPALLRDGSHALLNLPALTRVILDENRLKAIVDVLPYEEAIKLALERNAVRIAPMHGRRARRGGHPGPGAEAGEGEAHPGGEAQGGEAQAEAGDLSPPAHAAPRPPRPQGTRFRPKPDRRGPRPDRGPRPFTGPERPREVTAHGRHDGPPRGPRHDREPESHPGSVPVGGVIEVGRARSGLGNLGFALRNAGLDVTPRGQKERPPRKEREDASKRPPAQEPAQEPTAVASPPPPAPEQPAAAPAPPPPAPDFDVAGPA